MTKPHLCKEVKQIDKTDLKPIKHNALKPMVEIYFRESLIPILATVERPASRVFPFTLWERAVAIH
jgi:hypothetical protein